MKQIVCTGHMVLCTMRKLLRMQAECSTATSAMSWIGINAPWQALISSNMPLQGPACCAKNWILKVCHKTQWTHRLWTPLLGGRAGGGGRGALPFLLSTGASSSDELEDEESESESELDEFELEELDESEPDELSEEDESSAPHRTACVTSDPLSKVSNSTRRKPRIFTTTLVLMDDTCNGRKKTCRPGRHTCCDAPLLMGTQAPPS